MRNEHCCFVLLLSTFLIISPFSSHLSKLRIFNQSVLIDEDALKDVFSDDKNDFNVKKHFNVVQMTFNVDICSTLFLLMQLELIFLSNLGTYTNCIPRYVHLRSIGTSSTQMSLGTFGTEGATLTIYKLSN